MPLMTSACLRCHRCQRLVVYENRWLKIKLLKNKVRALSNFLLSNSVGFPVRKESGQKAQTDRQTYLPLGGRYKLN